MMPQIKSFGIVQTAKVTAVLYAVFAGVFFVPFALIVAVVGVATGNPAGLGALLFLLAPLAYAVVTFLFVALGCWVYNLIAKKIGGIHIDLQ